VITSAATVTLTAAQVAKAFDLGQVSGPLAELNGREARRTWRLDTFGGAYFVKQYDRPCDMPTWSAWMRTIQGSWEIERAAFAAGLPVATPTLAPGATGPGTAPVGGERPVTVRVHQWVPGIARTDPASPPVAAQLGAFLGRVHRLLPSLDEWRRRPTWPEDWARVAPHGDGSEGTWRQGFRSAIPLLEEASSRCAAAAAEPFPLVRTHRDLHSHNVVERPDGQVMIIDWDAASTQRSDWELVEAALEMAGYLSGPPSRQVVDRFVTAYRDAGGPITPVTASSFAGLLMCSLNWLQFNLRRLTGRPTESAPGDPTAEAEVRISLVAVQQIMHHIDEWTTWFD
jgi:Ser/Thr protein kinase RdoA (MazF antagonist)